MADNVEITAGTGTPIATDEVGVGGNPTAHVQFVKLVDGTLNGTTPIVAGSGVLTSALRVVIAVDQSPVPVSDNGGSLTVDAPVGTPVFTRLSDGAAALIGQKAMAASLPVVLASDQSSIPVTNAGTFATQESQLLTDNEGFTDGTSKLFPCGFIYDEVAGTALTENDVAASRININRALVGVIEDGATRARYATVTAANALKVDASSVAVPVTDNAGSLTVDAPVGTPVNVQIGNATLSVGVVDETGASAVDALAVGGGTPHDSVDSGNPVKQGARAIAHGSNPTAVAAGDRTDLYANRAGVPFTIGGHPNIVTASVRIADATGAQTDAAIAPGTIGTGTKIVVTRITVTCSNANTVNVAVKIGFGTTTLPADSTTGAIGVLADHEGVPPGGGFNIGDGSGILGIGGDGEELRLTCDDPVGGFIIVSYSYYTIES